MSDENLQIRVAPRGVGNHHLAIAATASRQAFQSSRAQSRWILICSRLSMIWNALKAQQPVVKINAGWSATVRPEAPTLVCSLCLTKRIGKPAQGCVETVPYLFWHRRVPCIEAPAKHVRRWQDRNPQPSVTRHILCISCGRTVVHAMV